MLGPCSKMMSSSGKTSTCQRGEKGERAADNWPRRYGIKEDLQKLMEETSNFYFLYNIKQEPIPDEEEWELRYEQFAKRVPPMEDGDESDVLSNVEEEFDETNVSSDVEEGGAKFDSGRIHDVLVGHSEDNVSEGYQIGREEL